MPRLMPATRDGRELGVGAWVAHRIGDPVGWFGHYHGYPTNDPKFRTLQCAQRFAYAALRMMLDGRLRRAHPDHQRVDRDLPTDETR